MKDILNRLIKHHTLSYEEAKRVLKAIANGEYNDIHVTAFMTVFMMRSITVEELRGFRDAMLDMCVAVDLSEYDPIDLCGTGGDGKDTFNISTLSSFIVAGAGQSVAKHGNNGVSSVCGSSNLLQHFGYQFTNEVSELKRSMDEANICFLHAPLFHPAMKGVAPIRKQLGMKTFFNMLGPMVNPAFPKKQLVGVFSLELARLYGYLYQQGQKDFAIVHSLDGYDEISLTGDFKLLTQKGESVLSPKDINQPTLNEQELFGGNSIEDAAAIFQRVLEGQGTKAQNAAVIANAGMALYAANPDRSIEEGQSLAEESLKSGAALKSFRSLVSPNKVFSLTN